MTLVAKWIVCSAWPYVNTVPHLGNMIGSILSADVFARFLRLRGEEVVFVSGSDEHGTPIEVEARKKGIEPRKLTDEVHAYVSELFRKWRISFDNYTRTESIVHHDFVKKFWLQVYNNGYVFTRKEVLPYCPRDEIFLPDRFIVGTCPYCGYPEAHGDQCDKCGRLLHPTELVNPRCVFCGSKPIFKETIHWFFDLPKLEGRVKEWLEKHEQFPDNVKNFSLGWVREGLKPRSITRDNKWGIPAPFPGAEGKTIYVWFDAVLGYISATKEWAEEIKGEPELWKRFWLNKDTRTIYFIGKDNIPFHAILFPAMLMASGEDYTLPYQIAATEYLMFEGEKFSKHRGIGVWIDEALEMFDADYWRWTLIRMRPEQKDTNFTWKEFYRIVNSELNDDIGNFVHRVLSFAYKNFNGIVPEPSTKTREDEKLWEDVVVAVEQAEKYFLDIKLKAASEQVLIIARRGNQYLNIREPWRKIKEDPEDAKTIIYIALNVAKTLAIVMEPFMPAKANELWSMLGLEGTVEDAGWNNAKELLLKPGHKINKPRPLFKKLPSDFLDKVNDLLLEARTKAKAKRPKVLG